MDKLTAKQRSENMRRVRSSGTQPEIDARRIFRKLGLAHTINNRSLPGRPDFVIPKFKTAIFVHGCFWHQHPGCADASKPKTRRRFWALKLAKNVARDRNRIRQLQRRGWKVAVIWACSLERNPEKISARLRKKFHGNRN